VKQPQSLPAVFDSLPTELEESVPVAEVRPESPAWTLLARTSPQATIFHQPEWAQVIGRTYGLRPRYLLLSRAGGRRSGLPLFQAGGLLRRRLVSLPFSDTAGPLLAGPQDLEPLVAAARSAAPWAALEIRGGCPEPPAGFSDSRAYCLFVLDLAPDLDALRSGLQRSTTLRSLKAAEKGPLRVREGGSEADMRAFYRLNLLTRRRHGVPPQPWGLFRNLWRLLAPAGLLTLLLAEADGTPVAGMVLLHFRETTYYKFGASDPAELRLRPNHLLMWRAIEWAKRRGSRRLDLGRTHRGNDGLLRFKLSWGARQLPLPYWSFPPSPGPGRLAEGGLAYHLLTSCWRRLPLGLTRLGGLFYRHFA
jgi:CelD/BcsL family acetyltransferase involved in cellulose biosynthesis